MLTIFGKALLVLLVLAVWIVPGAWWLSSGVMPYLHPLRLVERCLVVAVLVVFMVRLWAATWKRLPEPGSQNRLVLYLVLAFAVLFAAGWSANLMGMLVRAAPQAQYAGRFRIVDISSENRRTDGVRVILCDARGDFELFLDDDRFSYGDWRPGQVIGVAGVHGPFGVLAQRVRRLGEDPALHCA
jgi:hypothetical protein